MEFEKGVTWCLRLSVVYSRELGAPAIKVPLPKQLRLYRKLHFTTFYIELKIIFEYDSL
jgi:hypothetical protein